MAAIVGTVMVTDAAAQIRDDRYPFLDRRQRQSPPPTFNPFGLFQNWPDFQYERRRYRENRERTPSAGPAVDFSKAPPPRKAETTPAATVLVLGDSLADWLAHGLEEALADHPEIGIVRRNRASSGLIRSDARGESYDWVHAAREFLNTDKPDFVVMMIGLSDRHPIRERGRTIEGGQPQGADAIAGVLLHEFQSDRWSELYSKRIDDTIAVLRSRGTPVLWVGLPTIRGARAKAEITFLNELYRARAQRAGIVYVDVWDGFVDEDGNFASHGPDYNGQIRRLRAGDGVHFTKAGAVKLAHYVAREIQRLMQANTVPVALPAQEPGALGPGGRPGVPAPRPAAGPVVSLTAPASGGELVGASPAREPPAGSIASRVLVHGQPLDVPPGRADDFTWPRPDLTSDILEFVPATTPAIPAAVRAAPERPSPPAERAGPKRPGKSAAHPPQRQAR